MTCILNRSDLYLPPCAHAERAAQKLRDERRLSLQISVFVATSPFVAGETYYGNQATPPIQDSRDIIQAARRSPLSSLRCDAGRFSVFQDESGQQGLSQVLLILSTENTWAMLAGVFDQFELPYFNG